jgi:hypothetical protein
MNKRNTKKALTLARSLIADHWTQGAYARDKHGAPVRPTSDLAASWCALGALNLACDKFSGERFSGLRGDVAEVLYATLKDLGINDDLVGVNDSPARDPAVTHRLLVNVFDVAIGNL